ncbi:MAG TPA: hypothetical protein DCE42_02885 [Myxococcales bacterium]|nr:hypothetical protein [Deltaproteobacteria bacterium]HAA53671.1 hypothetical protein [Myxococcales bacterium]
MIKLYFVVTTRTAYTKHKKECDIHTQKQILPKQFPPTASVFFLICCLAENVPTYGELPNPVAFNIYQDNKPYA